MCLAVSLFVCVLSDMFVDCSSFCSLLFGCARYLDRVDLDLVESVGKLLRPVVESAHTATSVSHRLWRVEFDARYTLAVLGTFLNL